MTIEKINDVLSNMQNLESKFKLISQDVSDGYNYEKDQGSVGMKVEIFDIGESDTFLKVVSNTDSYGDNEAVVKLQFVKANVKTVIEYI